MIPLRDTVRSRCTPWMTWALIGANTLVFLFQSALPPDALERFVYLFGMVPARYTSPGWARWFGLPAGTLWPFVTHMFLHGNLAHLLGNMWTLWIFGDNVEDRMGPFRFLLFYLLGGLAAALAQFAMTIHSRVPMVGASGAVAGVLGAYFIMFPRSRVLTIVPIFFYPLFVEIPAVTYLLVWFVSQLWAGMLHTLAPVSIGGIAWCAHIGGFVFGLLAHPFFASPRRCAERAWVRGAWSRGRAWEPFS